MNANKHTPAGKPTPGPWHLQWPSADSDATDPIIVDMGEIPVAYVQESGSAEHGQDATSIVNARLIAAAPDLLDFAALVARMKTEDEMGENGPASEDWIATLNELIVSARAVVGKAEGKVTT